MSVNLTFDDGEPLDIAKFNALYSLILDAKATADSAKSLYNNSIEKVPQSFSKQGTRSTINNTKLTVITLNYSEMGLRSGDKPVVSVTPRGPSDNVQYVKFFTRDIGPSSAQVHAIIQNKDVKEVDVYFDFVVVCMKTTS